jgi:hypothetical protein
MALEHGELKDEFKSLGKSTQRERPWVCLQRKAPDHFDFKTTGPFSTEEVREQLLAGKIHYTDYVWKNDFVEWKRIGLIEDFNPRLKKMEIEPNPSPEKAEELMRNIVPMKRPKIPEPEPLPKEAETKDLTKYSELNLGLPELPPMPPPAQMAEPRPQEQAP